MVGTLRDYATGLPATVPSDAAPADLLRAADGHGYVAVTEAGLVIALLDAAEPDPPLPVTSAATRALLPPLVILPADLAMADLVSSPAITLLDLDSPAALLVDPAGEPVAILLVSAIVDYLADPGYAAAQRRLGPHGPTTDGTWPTATRVPLARLHCAAAGCGYLNELVEYVTDPPIACASPEAPRHDLVLGRR
ncbi:hypothetical protein Ais01nite_12760 [Asanoa ishikariensis]|uniref:CBS domain-containing protein n=1 Tax=Asanoa ishikariensis TaxID=137265 RepID=A0A1H3SZQ0_9ACTN|nr:hypothetical protein [Asanoa ishikariensis]GIF63241.1 hypothetical protein Ais01nite_12760 [Asanoa ishikariensis]SDZ43098.1 hypothetical protein SAMN05421684_4951 [Asanoa ishikariensis]